MSKVIIFSLFLLLSIKGYNQHKYTFRFKTVGGRPLPYTTVLWTEKNGLSANEFGVCTINTEVKIDSFVFSNVGCKARTFYTNDINEHDTIRVVLEEIEKELQEIIVISNGTIIESGVLEARPNSFVINQTPIHVQEAIRCNIEKPFAKIISFLVFVKKGKSTDVPLRIRIYNNGKNNLPDEDVLTESVILREYKSNAWNEVSLEDFNLYLKKGTYYAGIEWLSTSQTSENQLEIGEIANKRQEQKTYIKFANRSWRQQTCNNGCTNIMIKLKLLQ
jgi:hypothetical protein